MQRVCRAMKRASALHAMACRLICATRRSPPEPSASCYRSGFGIMAMTCILSRCCSFIVALAGVAGSVRDTSDCTLRDLPGSTLLTCGHPYLPLLTYVEATHLVQMLLPQHGCGCLPGAELKSQEVCQHLQHSGFAASSRTCRQSLVGNLVKQGMMGVATCLPCSLRDCNALLPRVMSPCGLGAAEGCRSGGPWHVGLLARYVWQQTLGQLAADAALHAAAWWGWWCAIVGCPTWLQACGRGEAACMPSGGCNGCKAWQQALLSQHLQHGVQQHGGIADLT